MCARNVRNVDIFVDMHPICVCTLISVDVCACARMCMYKGFVPFYCINCIDCSTDGKKVL